MADFINYNFIFRYFWPIKVDFKIYFKTGIFKQWNDKELERRILLISLKDILEDVVSNKIVYALYLKKY